MAEGKGWLISDVLREAWLADTILLVADHLHGAVVSGGSAVRNITKIYRITYDVDFDTHEENFEEICNALKQANKALGAARSLDKYNIAGVISFKPRRNVKASFEGDRKLAPFVRWMSKEAYLNLHIMRVPDVPEMLSHKHLMRLETVIPVERTVPTADRRYLFYRKASRANTEARVEDFMDLTFLIDTATGEQLQQLAEYCSDPRKKPVIVKGIKNQISKKRDYIESVQTRLVYAALKVPANEWVDKAAETFESFLGKLQ